MRKVGIVGYGSTKFSRNDVSIESELLRATKSLFDQTKNLRQKDIDVVLVSTNDNSKYLSSILSELAGIEPKTSHTVENLCSSGTNGIVSGYSYLASGLADMALIVGADRYDGPGQTLEWDDSRGQYQHPIFWASIFTKTYKRSYGISEEDLATVPAKNHKNAQDNPNAYSHKSFSIDDIMHSKPLTEDLRLLDCCYPCTGGSAVLLASEDAAKQFTDKPVWINGVGQKTSHASFTKSYASTRLSSTAEAAKSAFEMSHLQSSSVDVAEIHDAFAVCEPMAIEDIGFVSRGHGIKYAKTLYETDSKKINPRGGLIGTGHPLGATGIAQTIEIVQQLQGQAGKRQVDNAQVGLVHNMSAAATSSTVLILKS